MLRIYGVILDVIKGLRGTMEALDRKDPDLARQMRRAASSVALNVAEGMHSQGRNRRARYHNAAGSMRETLACVEVGVALGYVADPEAALPASINPIMATLVKLTA